MDYLEKRNTRKLIGIHWKWLLLGILTLVLGCTTQYRIGLTILLFVKAELSHRYEIAWKYISQRDRKFKPKAEYIKEKQMQLPENKETLRYKEMVDWFTEIMVDSIEMDSTQAEVTVILSKPYIDSTSQDSILLRYPNYAEYVRLKGLAVESTWYRDGLLSFEERLHSEIQKEESLYWKDMQLKLRQLFRRRSAPYQDTLLTYSMIKEGRDWRVFLDWEKEAEIKKKVKEEMEEIKEKIREIEETIEKAKESITEFIESEILKEYKKAWDRISERDKAFKSKNEYLKEKKAPKKNEQAKLYQETVDRLTEVRIDTVEIDTNKAVVRVILKKPDTKSISKLIPMDPKKNEYLYWKAMRVKLQELIDDNEVPFVEDTLIRFLVKEDDEWKVFLDWGKLNLITKLIHEARKLEQSGWQSGNTDKLKDALNRYKQAVDLYAGPCVKLYPDLLEIWVKGKRICIQEKIDELSIKIAYFDKIILSNLCARDFSEYLPQYWNITGRVKNKGNKNLKAVRVIVSIMDENGKTIKNRTYSLLWEGVLKPGRTKRFEPLFLLTGPKRFKVRVQNFEFAK